MDFRVTFYVLNLGRHVSMDLSMMVAIRVSKVGREHLKMQTDSGEG